MLIDIAMPHVDGFTLLTQLRQVEQHRSAPAIALTAYARAEDRARTRQAGFAAHVAKPFDELLLLMTIHDLSLTLK
jgi:CheY-like chemotaxis protein